MKIIKPSTHRDSTTHYRVFNWVGKDGSGFAFPCDADGNVTPKSATAAESWRKCNDGTYDVTDEGVETTYHTSREPAVGRCACGSHVELSGFTNSCDRCGRDYNMSGQELAPREQWGEETGESISDILSIQ